MGSQIFSVGNIYLIFLPIDGCVGTIRAISFVVDVVMNVIQQQANSGDFRECVLERDESKEAVRVASVKE